MNSFSIFTFLLCVALSYCIPADQTDHYDNRYDNFDYEAIMKSSRLVTRYVDCVVNNIGCSPEGKALKENLPDALKTNCAKCTEKQRVAAIKVMTSMEKQYPLQWKRVLDKFDVDRKLWAAFKKAHTIS